MLKFICDYDWVGAEESFRKALELSPGSAEIYGHFSWMLASLTRWDEAIATARRAQELDPVTNLSDLANTLLRAGRVEEALAEARRSVEFNPNYARSRGVLGWALMAQGKPNEAIAELQLAAELNNDSIHVAQLGEGYGLVGRTDEARAVLRRLYDMSKTQYVAPYHFAYVYTGLGEQEKALDYLEQACNDRAGAVYGIKGSYLFDSLRSHPRFVALLRRMNLA
jgi:tetratricopeptide (TPR) repeat protein